MAMTQEPIHWRLPTKKVRLKFQGIYPTKYGQTYGWNSHPQKIQRKKNAIKNHQNWYFCPVIFDGFCPVMVFDLPSSIDWFKGKITGKSHDLHGKIYGFRLRFSLQLIHWPVKISVHPGQRLPSENSSLDLLPFGQNLRRQRVLVKTVAEFVS